MKYLLALALFVSSTIASAVQPVIAFSVSDIFVTTGSCVLVLKGADMSAATEDDLYMHHAAIQQFEMEARHYAQLLIDNQPGWESLTYEMMLDTLIEKWSTLPQESVQMMGESCMLAYANYLDALHSGEQEPFNFPEPIVPGEKKPAVPALPEGQLI